MAKQKVRLEVWVRYDSLTGYVWPQVYSSEKEAHLDERLNHPIKVMKLTSDPYFSESARSCYYFGTEVPAAERESEQVQVNEKG